MAQGKLRRFIEERLVFSPEDLLKLGLMPIGSAVTWRMTRHPIRVLFGDYRLKKDFDDKLVSAIMEYGIPTLLSYAIIYHPEAIGSLIGNVFSKIGLGGII